MPHDHEIAIKDMATQAVMHMQGIKFLRKERTPETPSGATFYVPRNAETTIVLARLADDSYLVKPVPFITSCRIVRKWSRELQNNT